MSAEALALRELEADAAREQGDDERVDRDALLLGAPDQLGIEVSGYANEPFRRIGHRRDDTTGDILSATTKRAGGATNTPAPATGGRS